MPFKDKEKAKEYNRQKKLEYYKKNPKKFNEYRKKFKKSKPTKEKAVKYSLKYYYKNKSLVLEKLKKFRDENRKKINEQAREYRRKNFGWIRINDATELFNRGDITHAEYCRRVQSAIDEANEKV